MLAFVVQRLLQAIVVMLVVGLVSFALFQFVGDPINNMVGQDATEEQRQLLREKLGIDQPWPIQFVNWIGNALQGEFGLSYRMGVPVESIIAVSRLRNDDSTSAGVAGCPLTKSNTPSTAGVA